MKKKIFVSIWRKKINDTLVVDLTASKEDVHLFIIQISLMFKKKAYQKLEEKHPRGWIGPEGSLLWNPDDQNMGQATSNLQVTHF